MSTNFKIPTTDERLNNMLISYSNIAQSYNYNVDVSPGTDIYCRFSAIAQALSLSDQNAKLARDAMLLDTAQEDDLIAITSSMGITRKSATPAQIYITLTLTQTSTYISEQTELTSASGVKYYVLFSGTYKNNDKILLQSRLTGSKVNVLVGDALSWVQAPQYCTQKSYVFQIVTVGFPIEDIESLRRRAKLLQSQPPGSGNAAHCAKLATDSAPEILTSFTYPCSNGPGTFTVACINKPDFTASITRTLPNSILSKAYVNIVNNIPETCYKLVVPCRDRKVDLSIKLTLPNQPSSKTPGDGSGWVDAVPIPYVLATPANASPINYSTVDTIISSTSINFRSNLDPTGYYPNNTRSFSICIWNKITYTLVKATVTSFGVVADGDSFVISATLDRSISVNLGDYVFPASYNVDENIAIITDYFYSLGPSEIVSTASLLPQARRRPDNVYSMYIDDTLNQNLVRNSVNIKNSDFLVIEDPLVGGLTAPCKPPTPTYVYQSPYVWVPRNIGLYPSSEAIN